MNNVIRHFFVKNIGLKLLSVALAILAWCMIMNLSDPKVTVNIKNGPVNKTNEQAVVDENMIYNVVSGDTISVTITGPRSIVQTLTASDIYAYVNLKELSLTNACPIHVSFNNSSASKSAEIVSKSEEVMELALEQMVTENKQIDVKLKGTPASDYYATWSVAPLMLEVYGSATQVSNIEKLVATVDIEGKSTSFTESVTVVPYDKQGNVLDVSKFTMNESSAEVEVKLYPTKNINLVIDADVSAEYGFACEPLEQAPTSITIAGEYSVIKDITEIIIPFKRENLKETLAENINIKEYLPEGCYLVSETETVSVTVPVVMLDERKDISVDMGDIDLKNLQVAFELKNNTDKTSVTIWGAEGTTDSVVESQLGLYVDCSSIKAPGTYELPLQYNTNLQLLFNETTVTVKVGTKATAK